MRWLVFTWLVAAVALAYGLNVARNARYDPSLSDPATRGVVIEGLCPAPVDPVTISTATRPGFGDFYGATFDLHGTAREDGIVLSWDPLEIDGLTGYLVTRYKEGAQWEAVGSQARVFAVDAAYGVRQYIDDDGLEPLTRYKYRVFPVTTAGISGRSWSLWIRTLPTRVPAAPGRLDAKFYTDSLKITSYSGFLEPVTGMRVLRRPVGESVWDIVHDGPTGGEYYRETGPERTWNDEDAGRSVRYEYAVCLTNRLGVGRAALVAPKQYVDTVPVGPPQGINAVVTGGAITVYWEPLEERSVVGYEVERYKVGVDDTNRWSLRMQTEHRSENYIDQPRYNLPSAPRQRYRVRAMTVYGPGEWSPEVVVDTTAPLTESLDWDEYWSSQEDGDPVATIAQPVEEIPIPEVVSLTATHDEVYFVWRAEGSFKGVQHRILRREVGNEQTLMAFHVWNWLEVDEFDWERRYEVSETGFTDQYDVRPDTEYEYAVQLRSGDQLGQPTRWASVRTEVLPATLNRFPLQVYDLAATPTSDGIDLTWTLPDDPTLTSIEIVRLTYDFDAIGQLVPDIALPPDATSYIDEPRIYSGLDRRVCFFVSTFNHYGMQSQLASQSCVTEADMLHCGVPSGEVGRDDYGNGVVVTFRGCEETAMEVTRHELTPDGLEVESFLPPCGWTDSPNYRFPGTLECEFVDSSVKPETWYLYELAQTFEDGRTSTTYDEVITDRHREWMP